MILCFFSRASSILCTAFSISGIRNGSWRSSIFGSKNSSHSIFLFSSNTDLRDFCSRLFMTITLCPQTVERVFDFIMFAIILFLAKTQASFYVKSVFLHHDSTSVFSRDFWSNYYDSGSHNSEARTIQCAPFYRVSCWMSLTLGIRIFSMSARYGCKICLSREMSRRLGLCKCCIPFLLFSPSSWENRIPARRTHSTGA